MRLRHLAIAVPLLILPCSTAEAQKSADDLAKATANPIANLISVPFQNNTDFGLGPYDRTRNVLNIQPVVPFWGGKVVTRTIIPIAWLPDVSSPTGSLSSGLADIVFTAFYVPTSGSFTWGIGPVLQLPTGGELRGTQKWSIGPSALALKQAGPWTLGVLANQVWSFAGNSDRESVSQGQLQYFIVYQLGHGWYVNSAPIITVNWKADDGQRLVVPFGAGAGKLFFAGKLPINVQVGAYANVVKPDIGPDWQLRSQVQFVLPTP